MIVVPLSYTVLFGEDNTPTREDLIKGIPSKFILLFLAIINHQLDRKKTDTEIISFLSEGWDVQFRSTFAYAMDRAKAKGAEERKMFAKWITTEAIKDELLNYRSEPAKISLSPIEETEVFIAYLKFVDDLLSRETFNPKEYDVKPEKPDWFIDNTWSHLLPQWEFQATYNLMFEAFKGAVFLNEIKKIHDKKSYVKTYLASYGYSTIWELVNIFIDVIKKAWYAEKEIAAPILYSPSGSVNRLFMEEKTIDPNEYKEKTKSQQRYNGILKAPLFQYDDNRFIVLNWSFFISQISIGLLFDFFQRSGIKGAHKNNFGDFKSEIGKRISENVVFRGLINAIFRKKHLRKSFDEGLTKPDAYIRDGNYIYVFEYKDTLFPNTTIETFNSDEIKQLLDNRFCKNQGVKQLIKHIIFLEYGSIGNDHLDNKSRESLTIIPVLVYDDLRFSMPGVNFYVNKRFLEQLPKAKFRKVYPLTMISLTFLYENLYSLQKENLRSIIKKFHKKCSYDLHWRSK